MTRMGRTALALVLGGLLPTSLSAQALPLTFSGDVEFSSAVEEYREIWRLEGERITEVIQRVSGLTFPVDSVSVQVINGPSWAGTNTMGMRATYPPDTKRATLVHELGHVLVGDLVPEDAPQGTAPTPHYLLFLFLYDAWIELWGQEFADEQVEVESARRGGFVDYEAVWQAVLESDAEERAAQLREIIDRYSSGD